MAFSRRRLLPVAVTLVALIVLATAGYLVWSRILQPSLALVAARDAIESHAAYAADKACAECHTSVHRAPLVGACDNCHTPGTWASTTYRHTREEMDTGAHKDLRCAECHTRREGMPNSACGSCHKVYGHATAYDCASCHTTTSWTTSHKPPKAHVRLTGEHKKLTCADCHRLHDRRRVDRCKECHKEHPKKFRLTQGHAGLSCGNCHTVMPDRDNLNNAGIRAKDCGACHQPQHEGLLDCARCHSAAGFKKPIFEHETVWALTGKHRDTKCADCHPGKEWKKSAGTTCDSCHETVHTGLTDCARCHTTAGFERSRFEHSSVYVLAGTHRKITCSKCHPGNDYGRTNGTSCSSCHGKKHGGLTDCAKCHTTTSFKPATFQHSSAWPKTGAHKRVACNKCHPGAAYTKTKGTTCVACHGGEHGGERACSKCHTTSTWGPIKRVTHTPRYPLTGQHRYVDCKSCHEDLVFSGTPNTCYDCHAALKHCDHNDCERCHTTESWSQILPHEAKHSE